MCCKLVSGKKLAAKNKMLTESKRSSCTVSLSRVLRISWRAACSESFLLVFVDALICNLQNDYEVVATRMLFSCEKRRENSKSKYHMKIFIERLYAAGIFSHEGVVTGTKKEKANLSFLLLKPLLLGHRHL